MSRWMRDKNYEGAVWKDDDVSNSLHSRCERVLLIDSLFDTSLVLGFGEEDEVVWL